MKDIFGIDKLLLVVFLILSSYHSCIKNAKAKVTFETYFPIKTVILKALKRPWSAAFSSSNEGLISEKEGNLLQVDLTTKVRAKIKAFPEDLADSLLVDASKHPLGTFPRNADGKKLKYNTGVFDIVLHPNFKSNNTIYVSYVAKKRANSTI
jgi:hypothetical protein